MQKYFTYFLVLSFFSCQDTPEIEKDYLFLGHPYDWQDWYKIDPRLEKLDYSQFDQVWLGGDVCAATTKKKGTIEYLDSIFDLGSNKLQWTLGNHDVKFENIDLITNKTHRNTFYTTSFDDLTLLVLNTNLFNFFNSKPAQEKCEEKIAQLAMIKSVTDTISASSHLVILHHASILNELKKDTLGQIPDIFNINYGNIQATCDSASYLTEWLYPKLKKVRKRGVKVMLIGGDLGMRAKEYSFMTPDSIVLLGSGINNSVNFEEAPEYVINFEKDKVLILHRNVTRKTLEWEFVLLDSLVEATLQNSNTTNKK